MLTSYVIFWIVIGIIGLLMVVMFWYSGASGKYLRSREDKVIAGVCSGMAKTLNTSTTFVRFAFIVYALGGSGIGIVFYLLLWALIPKEPPFNPFD